jgi:hypothetical protein
LLIVECYYSFGRGKTQFAHKIIIFYITYILFDRYMRVTPREEERPLLLLLAAAAAAVRSIFFTVTPPAYADDLTEEDILSLLHPQHIAICHIPEGNPDNAHTITIGASAVVAHGRNHGHYISACQPVQP